MQKNRERKRKLRKESKLEKEVRLAIEALHALPTAAAQANAFARISPLLDKSLADKKLWRRDFDPKCTPFENGMPSLQKRTAFREEDTEAGAIEVIAEDGRESRGYEPDPVDDVFESDQLEMEAEETHDDFDAGGFSIHPFFPLRSTPPLNRLMRRAPPDLKNSIARDLFDSSYFLTHERQDLLPALCFFEVSIFERLRFECVRCQVYRNGRYYKAGKKFSFEEYQRDLLRLYHVIAKKKRGYFVRNRTLEREVRRTRRDPAKALESLWARFETAFEALTQKQRNAVERTVLDGIPQVKVAKTLRISLDSLRDRLEGAFLKFRTALPELAHLVPSSTYRQSSKRNYVHSGLFDKRAAAVALPIHSITPGTGSRTQLPRTRIKPRPRKGVDRERVRAWILKTTPVPDFSFTDYFTGLISRGALDRMSTLDTVHDRSASRSNYANKPSARLKARSR